MKRFYVSLHLFFGMVLFFDVYTSILPNSLGIRVKIVHSTINSGISTPILRRKKSLDRVFLLYQSIAFLFGDLYGIRTRE